HRVGRERLVDLDWAIEWVRESAADNNKAANPCADPRPREPLHRSTDWDRISPGMRTTHSSGRNEPLRAVRGHRSRGIKGALATNAGGQAQGSLGRSAIGGETTQFAPSGDRRFGDEIGSASVRAH